MSTKFRTAVDLKKNIDNAPIKTTRSRNSDESMAENSNSSSNVINHQFEYLRFRKNLNPTKVSKPTKNEKITKSKWTLIKTLIANKDLKTNI